MQITSAGNDNPRIRVFVQDVQPTVTDLYPQTVQYTSPAIAHRGYIGIKQVPADRYLVGFIQCITHYRFVVEYDKGRFKIKVPLPISDGGGDDPPEVFRTPAHDLTVGLPWYQPPLKVTEAEGGNYRKPFTFYSTEVNDAPQGTFTWTHQSDDNTLRALTREHRFQTWLVIWDKTTGSVAEHLAMSTWEHKVSMSFDHAKPKGERVQVHWCTNLPVGTPAEPPPPLGPIPAQALAAPTANVASRSGQYYKDRAFILPHSSSIK